MPVSLHSCTPLVQQRTSADCLPSPLPTTDCPHLPVLPPLPCPPPNCPPHPTELLQATSANYKPYAQRLATWGFATLQYDFMRLSPWIDQLCHSDAAEVRGGLVLWNADSTIDSTLNSTA